MKKIVIYMVLIVGLTSCVSAKRYASLENEIARKQKSLVKLNNQLEVAKTKNTHLRDSAERMMK